MALDGITIANITHELNTNLSECRLYKIAQPEQDELLLTFKGKSASYKLTISASASLPLIYLTDTNKPSPLTAPNFCMLLRKHLGNARLIKVTQPGLERIIRFTFEHLDEMGDLCTKHLIVELMGKYSNIIFTNNDNTIIDSIKHISAQTSSVREVLPGRNYFIPDTTNKANPLELEYKTFNVHVLEKPMNIGKAIYMGLTGISPIISEEMCHIAGIDSSQPAITLNETEKTHLYNIVCQIMSDIREHSFCPNIIYKDGVPVEFASIPLSIYDNSQGYNTLKCDLASQMLFTFFAEKNAVTRIYQKSADLRKIIGTLLERNYRKCDLQEKQLKDTEKKDKYRIYGELINTYGYDVKEGSKSFETLNYYTNEMITIPLDETISVHDNAVKYFDKYNKLKRTYEATTKLLEETKAEINHLESIATSLDIAVCEEDLIQLKEEMIESGYIHKKNTGNKKVKITSKPFHYISSDGYHIYVGKNNLQNEELSFKFANGNDWWFHAKEMPGSHVIVKSNGDELPDRTFEEAAKLAAYYSSAKGQERIEVDYTQKKHLKKPPQAKPGFVIYHTNYSMVTDSDITGLQVIK